MSRSETYDYIIAGGGAAGLNLVYALADAGLTGKRILLLDRAPKTTDDRTWCFWENHDNIFEALIHRRWERLAFHGPGLSKVLEPAPYVYKMLRGIDFYQHMDAWLAQQPNITRMYGEVQCVDSVVDGAAVTVDAHQFRTRFAFDSRPQSPPVNPRGHNLLQHFLGWVIECAQPVFDPAVATLMDFRIEQAGETRFVYVLPLDERRALVEFTVFSRALLPRADYAPVLRDYIERQLQFADFAITHEEFGVIPMSDAPFIRRPSPNVMRIGTAGGASKPSTGYTFLRTQRQAWRIADSLHTDGTPFYHEHASQARYRLFDRILLGVLDRQHPGGAAVFARLFARNPPARIFKFLDEDSNVPEDLALMATVDIPLFLRAMCS